MIDIEKILDKFKEELEDKKLWKKKLNGLKVMALPLK